MANDCYKAKIYAHRKKIDSSGHEFEVREIIIAGESLKECEKVFDRKRKEGVF